MKIQFTWKPAPTTCISLLLLALLFPLGLSLPDWWGWENGPLENIQIVILGGGLLTTWLAADYNRHERKIRNLWLWLTPFWLLCIGRELSWGRIFYPVSIGVHGPGFITLQQLSYGYLVKSFVAIVLVITLIAIYRTDPITYVRQTRLPCLDFVTLLLTVLIAVFCDKNLIPFLQPYHQVVEEWAELPFNSNSVLISTLFETNFIN